MDDDVFFSLEATLDTSRRLSTAVYVENAESVLHDTNETNQNPNLLPSLQLLLPAYLQQSAASVAQLEPW
jgi:hypothetical protein